MLTSPEVITLTHLVGESELQYLLRGVKINSTKLLGFPVNTDNLMEFFNPSFIGRKRIPLQELNTMLNKKYVVYIVLKKEDLKKSSITVNKTKVSCYKFHEYDHRNVVCIYDIKNGVRISPFLKDHS